MESGGGYFFDPSACRGNMLFMGNTDSVYRGQTLMEETSKRNLFFSSTEDLFDEEYYHDSQLPEKKRRLTIEQVQLLEKSFESENKLEGERKTELAKKLGLQPRQVAVWFQNRRARWKTRQLERDYDLLKSSYDTLLSSYNSLVKESNKLKAQMSSLTEKFEIKKSEQLLADTGNGNVEVNLQIEDRLSSGSNASGVVDNDVAVLDGGILSDEDDDEQGSDFSNVFTEQPALAQGWWVWS